MHSRYSPTSAAESKLPKKRFLTKTILKAPINTTVYNLPSFVTDLEYKLESLKVREKSPKMNERLTKIDDLLHKMRKGERFRGSSFKQEKYFNRTSHPYKTHKFFPVSNLPNPETSSSVYTQRESYFNKRFLEIVPLLGISREKPAQSCNREKNKEKEICLPETRHVEYREFEYGAAPNARRTIFSKIQARSIIYTDS